MSLLANRYQLLESLGAGAMGQVHRALDTCLNSEVAIKFLAQQLQSVAMCDRFLLEAQACAQLGSKSHYIVKVMDVKVKPDGVPFYVMEVLQGKSLKQVMGRQPLPLARFLNLSQQICLGLQCAHEGIRLSNDDTFHPVIHCDIKPSNIFVVPASPFHELVKILDFGVATLGMKSDQDSAMNGGSFKGGTLPYCSPEQIAGNELDPRSDIYSFGILMFEMLTAKLPFQVYSSDFANWYNAHTSQPPASFAAIAPDLNLPPSLQSLVMDCLAKSASDRPQSMTAILDVLHTLAQQYGIQSPSGQSLPPVLSAVEHPPAPNNPSLLQALPQDFPAGKKRLITSLVIDQERMPAIGMVLPHQDIQTIQIYGFYNKIYQDYWAAPPPHHSVLLWLTAIFTPKLGVFWLPFYLDLRSPSDSKLLHLLCQTGRYQILLYDQEEPHWCSHSVQVTLTQSNRDRLQAWSLDCQSRGSIGSAPNSKRLLKDRFDHQRPELERKLQDNTNQS